MASTKTRRRPGRPRRFNEPMSSPGFYLPTRLMRRIDSLASARGESRNQWVAKALERAAASSRARGSS